MEFRRLQNEANRLPKNRGARSMSRLRVLLLGPDCHPEKVSIPYVTYSHAAALADIHDVTIAVRSWVESAVRSANAPFQAIEVVRTPLFDRFENWFMRRVLKYNYDTQVKTAIGYPGAIAFEWHAWRHFRSRIFKGEFDVVLRLVPMSPSLPSPFAFFLRNGPIPFVIGPLNGGLPWPSGFSQLVSQKEWISGLRGLYRFLPFTRSTYRHAAAIIAASSQTYSEFDRYRDKLFFIPEPGISQSVFSEISDRAEDSAKLELIFVGGLVPRKACDLALRGAANLLRTGRARFTVVGDGPERERLVQMTRSLGIEAAVSFCGWISLSEVFDRFRNADIFVFPSIRDNGAGVVFQALATGAVPVVADFGGPGDIVHQEIGRKVPLTEESDFVTRLEAILEELASDRELVKKLRRQGIAFAREHLTWDAKAKATTGVLNWVVGRCARPMLLPPKLLNPIRQGRLGRPQ
jgi:glycosyltransferase involved in cell wall biosynthesis